MKVERYIELRLLEALEYTKYSNEESWSFLIKINDKNINFTGDVKEIENDENAKEQIIETFEKAIAKTQFSIGELQIKELIQDLKKVKLFGLINECITELERIKESNPKFLKLLDRSKFNMIEIGYFLAYYHKAVDGQQDLVSQILLCFKDDEEPETSEWIQLATLTFPSNYKPDIILRSLRSSETTASSSSSLDKLGRAIAKKIGSSYEPSCLSKIRPTRPFHLMKTKQERFDEIHGVYRYNGHRVKNILLLDDIVTTSSTITEIKRAITASIGEINLRVFVLGKTFDSWRDGEGDNSEIESYFSNATAY